MRELITICFIMLFVLVVSCPVRAGQIDVVVTDMTPTEPLQTPLPSAYQPRYISGFGSGDSFTLFFEDRDAGSKISYVSTTTGPTGLSASATPSNIFDTHFCVKDWPISIGGTDYAYRAWGAMWDTPKHNFYVSNDLKNWTLVSTFTIPNFEDFHSGYVYYGFHDVIELNGTYYAWGEGNIDRTLMCRSANGADDWEAFDRVGGLHTPSSVGPLGLPDVGTPTGSFFELGGDRGYGKIMVPGDDSTFYLAVNTAAKPSLPPAQLEAAFIDPSNWMWHDGTTGLATTPILASTDEHDLRECWLVSSSDNEWTIVYDADFGTSDGGKALGYAILSIPLPNTPPFANAGPDQTVEQESYAGTQITLDGSGSTDPDSTPGTNDDIVLFEWYEGSVLLGTGKTLNHTFPLGGYTVTLKVTDSFGKTDEDEVIIVVEDTTDPDVTIVSVVPEELWPPNHKMVSVIALIEALDICTETEALTLEVTVVSSEPDDDKDNDRFTGDVDGKGGYTDPVPVLCEFDEEAGWFVSSFELRAEHDGHGVDRIYTITATVKDASGNTATDTVELTVPHDKGKDQGKSKEKE